MLPFQRKFCVHHSTMHQVTVPLHSKPHRLGVCMFSCTLPPALLAEWPGSFTCYCHHTTASRSTRKSARTANISYADCGSALLTVSLFLPNSILATDRSRRGWRAQCHHRLPLLVAVDRHKWCQWVLQTKRFPDTSQCPALSLVETFRSFAAKREPMMQSGPVWTGVRTSTHVPVNAIILLVFF